MKKLLAYVLAFVLTVAIILSQTGFAAAATEEKFDYTGSYKFDVFLEIMDNEYQNRSALSKEHELKSAQFMAMEFLKGGLKPTLSTDKTEFAKEDFIAKSITTDMEGNTIEVKNVIGYRPASNSPLTAKNVIISAHYDNVYGFEVVNPYNNIKDYVFSYGINDNASGLAVMLAVLNDLANTELDFNIIFIAFGSQELGLLGSKAYHANMSDIDKQNLLLLINIDSVIAGDYLYLFSKDWKTEHEKFIADKSAEIGANLKTFPREKKFSNDMFGGFYSHKGYLADNYYFLKDNLNTALFMSYNMSATTKAGVSESNTHPNITNTQKDTLAKIQEYYPDYLEKMQRVTDIIKGTLTDDDFVSSMTLSQKSPSYALLMNQNFLNIINLVLCIIAIVGAVVYYGKLKKISKIKMEEFLKDPQQMQKVNIIFKDFQNMNDFKNFTYHPRTYKPKDGDKDFSVFGESFEAKDEGYGATDKNKEDIDNKNNSENNNDNNKDDNNLSDDDIFKL